MSAPKIDRAALIEAAERAFVTRSSGPVTDELWSKIKRSMPNGTVHRRDVQLILDAVLPLIADAIEAEADKRRASMAALSWGEPTRDPASAHYLRRAARLVRSLAGGA